jgi:hypothetical protein
MKSCVEHMEKLCFFHFLLLLPKFWWTFLQGFQWFWNQHHTRFGVFLAPLLNSFAKTSGWNYWHFWKFWGWSACKGSKKENVFFYKFASGLNLEYIFASVSAFYILSQKRSKLLHPNIHAGLSRIHFWCHCPFKEWPAQMCRKCNKFLRNEKNHVEVGKETIKAGATWW